jgi:hypothetical protein
MSHSVGTEKVLHTGFWFPGTTDEYLPAVAVSQEEFNPICAIHEACFKSSLKMKTSIDHTW